MHDKHQMDISALNAHFSKILHYFFIVKMTIFRNEFNSINKYSLKKIIEFEPL